MSLININIKSKNPIFKSAVGSRPFANKVIALLVGIVSGAVRGSIAFSQDGAGITPAKAVFTVTLNQTNLIAGETIDLGAVLTCSSGAPANQGEWQKGANVAASCTNLANCINGHSLVGKKFSAVAGTSTVVITALQSGSVPLPASTKDASSGIAVAATTRGAGGAIGPEVVMGR